MQDTALIERKQAFQRYLDTVPTGILTTKEESAAHDLAALFALMETKATQDARTASATENQIQDITDRLDKNFPNRKKEFSNAEKDAITALYRDVLNAPPVLEPLFNVATLKPETRALFTSNRWNTVPSLPGVPAAAQIQTSLTADTINDIQSFNNDPFGQQVPHTPSGLQDRPALKQEDLFSKQQDLSSKQKDLTKQQDDLLTDDQGNFYRIQKTSPNASSLGTPSSTQNDEMTTSVPSSRQRIVGPHIHIMVKNTISGNNFGQYVSIEQYVAEAKEKGLPQTLPANATYELTMPEDRLNTLRRIITAHEEYYKNPKHVLPKLTAADIELLQQGQTVTGVTLSSSPSGRDTLQRTA